MAQLNTVWIAQELFACTPVKSCGLHPEMWDFRNSKDRHRVESCVPGQMAGQGRFGGDACPACLNHLVVTILSPPQDSFYKGLSAEEARHAADYNFDHPGNVAGIDSLV